MKKKIVLLNPPFALKPEPQVPLSVLAAGALLDQSGYDVKVVNGSTEPDFVARTMALCADAVCLGISSMTGHQIAGGVAASRAVKQRFPGLPIIWGGWHGSILPEQTAADPAVDVVVRGQGERTMLELVQAWESGNHDVSGIAGIAHKNNDGIALTAPRRFEDINHFPPLPYHLADVESILSHRAANPQLGRMLEYSSSQGCPNGCTFCAEPLVMGRRWSGLAAERVVDEWKFLVRKYNLSAIHFVDSNFFVDRSRVELICHGIIDARLPLTWHNANATVASLAGYQPEMWELLAASGCRSILVGAESGSQHMLDLVDKNCTTDDILNVAGAGNRYGIMISFSFMTGLPSPSGPEGTWREFKATMRLIHDVLRVNKGNDIKLFLYTPYPGSPLYEVSLAKGLKVPDTLLEWSRFELVNATTPWVSPRFKETVDLARMFVIPSLQRGAAMGYRPFTLIRRLLAWLSGLRLRHGYFGFPVEYRILHWWWKRKGVV